MQGSLQERLFFGALCSLCWANDKHSRQELIDCGLSFGNVSLHKYLKFLKPKAIAKVKALFSHLDSMWSLSD